MMRPSTADPYATSHAGQHGDFTVFFVNDPAFVIGWYWLPHDGWLPHDSDWHGPFATSQAAFGDCKDVIDCYIMGDVGHTVRI